MKIIAKTNRGFLIDCDRGEIAFILGFDGTHNTEFQNLKLEIGTALEVRKINEVSAFVRGLDKDKLKYLRENLQKTLDAINEATDTVHSLTLFDKLK